MVTFEACASDLASPESSPNGRPRAKGNSRRPSWPPSTAWPRELGKPSCTSPPWRGTVFAGRAQLTRAGRRWRHVETTYKIAAHCHTPKKPVVGKAGKPDITETEHEP